MAAVDHLGGHQGDPRVTVLGVVPGEERAAEGPGVLDGAEAVGKVGLVLEGLELGLGERVVVGDVRPAVGLVTPRSASRKATGLAVIESPGRHGG